MSTNRYTYATSRRVILYGSQQCLEFTGTVYSIFYIRAFDYSFCTESDFFSLLGSIANTGARYGELGVRFGQRRRIKDGHDAILTAALAKA